MNRCTLFLICILFVSFSACNDGKNKTPKTIEVTSGNDVTQSAKTTIKDVTFKDRDIAIIFHEYIGMKDAMVGTNPAKTGAQASRLRKAFVAAGADQEAISAAIQVMEAPNMAKQREAFVPLTAIVEKMMEGQIESGTIYKQYCPMAFSNEGASWLSASSDIMNPYFGSKMLRCGRIDGKIE